MPATARVSPNVNDFALVAMLRLLGLRIYRFYRPAYVGHPGWLGVRLDLDADWDEIEHLVLDAYLRVAPRSLAHRITHAPRP